MKKTARKIISSVLLCAMIVTSVFTLTGCDLSALSALVDSYGSDTPVEISDTEINADGELVIYYSDGTSKNLGVVVGKDGEDGLDGEAVGRSITSAEINSEGELILYYSDGTNENLGLVVGKDGADSEEPDVNITVNVTGDAESVASTVAVAAPSTVCVLCDFGVGGSISSVAAGSGVIYSLDKETGDALIITNYHVVYDSGMISNNISVYVYGSTLNEQAIEAEFVGGSMKEDIALLRVTGSEFLKNSLAKAVTFADSDAIYPGDTAIAIGNPMGKGFSATYGKVNVPSETLKTTACDNRTEVSLRVIRMDTAVNGGNSGGGLFDAEGKLIGIVNAKSIETNIENVGYAIPANKVHALVENIIHYCLDGDSITPWKPTFGVTVQIVDSVASVNPDGLIDIVETIGVVEVSASTPADGVFLAGDRLISVTMDGETFAITKMHHLTDFALELRPGMSVTFKVRRAGVEIDLVITPANNAYNPC